ncbi:MAG: hypothetical protein Unbinned8138contig1000_69 [Prokaryotic dsDNA virus sp.]|nr:MAG: hypothetical protein Unbinned8138contig1000_69 [Prokaryotic dsDNA virus sp.]|tara:strand:- start:242 stop:625 length:384 start_codon:yes stop_codon:yes gene_type:complete
MGYYSEVYIAVPKKAEAEMDKAMNSNNLLTKPQFETSPSFKKYDHIQKWSEYKDNQRIETSRELVIYEGFWLKWYPEYKDVQAVTSVVENHEDDGACIVCVGEDGAVHSNTGEYDDVFNVYVKVELT